MLKYLKKIRAYGPLMNSVRGLSSTATEAPPPKFQLASSRGHIRNIGIIAHVDHGKTTLVDCMLRAGENAQSEKERVMDRLDLEQERGITIMAKNVAINHSEHLINIVDTPGHSDFGGEVERIMQTIDGVILVVCSTEGPMPQTKFVLSKALQHNLRPIVVINKADRLTSRLVDVQNEVFDLFMGLEASEEQLEYPLFYASAKEGWAVDANVLGVEAIQDYLHKLNGASLSVSTLLDAVIQHIPPPQSHDTDTDSEYESKPPPVKMLITQTESNAHFGRILVGRVSSGQFEGMDYLQATDQDGNIQEKSRVLKILKRFGGEMRQVEIPRAVCGDILGVAGFEKATVGSTLNTPGCNFVIPTIPIEKPLVKILLLPNSAPSMGKDGDKVTMYDIRTRLEREAEEDVSLQINDLGGEEIEVSGRGDLHLGILVEKMRREGFEMSLSPPSIAMKTEGGVLLEPFEEITVEAEEKYMMNIIEMMDDRKGEMLDSVGLEGDRLRATYIAPSRGLLGFRSYLLSHTRGTALVKSHFDSYRPYKGIIRKIKKGALIATCSGMATSYALADLEKRGRLFVGPMDHVYEGMVIGEHNYENELDVNPTKTKKLTNIRTHAHDPNIRLLQHREFTIDAALSYIRGTHFISKYQYSR